MSQATFSPLDVIDRFVKSGGVRLNRGEYAKADGILCPHHQGLVGVVSLRADHDDATAAGAVEALKGNAHGTEGQGLRRLADVDISLLGVHHGPGVLATRRPNLIFHPTYR
jgi:hypothetical protein